MNMKLNPKTEISPWIHRTKITPSKGLELVAWLMPKTLKLTALIKRPKLETRTCISF